MRIETNNRTANVSSRGQTRSGASGAAFHVDEGPAATRAAGIAPAAPTGGIDALLALQAVEDPLFARRKAVRRANLLLDILEQVKADVLVGQVGEGRLNQMMALISQTRARGLPGLDGIIDDIELRVRVELAKLGRFPTP